MGDHGKQSRSYYRVPTAKERKARHVAELNKLRKRAR